MGELAELTGQRNQLLAKIREIESSCEGIENENNARRVEELNLKQTKINEQRQELTKRSRRP